MGAVSLGLWMGIFLMSFYNGMIEQRVKTAITTELSHIQLHHPEFRKDYDVKYILPNGREACKIIKNNKNVNESVGRLIIKGMVASAAGSAGITLNAVMPDEENKLTKLKEKIVSGNYFNPVKLNEIIISKKLAKKLKLNLKKKVIVTFQNKDGDLATVAFRIIALYKTVNGPYDDNNIFVNIKSVDSLVGLPNAINEIAVLLRSNDLLNQSQDELNKLFPNLEIKNWKELAPDLGLTVSAGDQMVYIFMGIILLSIAFGIINTMMMSVLERTKEIGMLLALGMNKVKIFLMILLETFFLILAGCPFGLVLAFSTILITQQTGISFSKFSEVYSSFGYSSVIYPIIHFGQFGSIMLLVFLTAIFSALFPAIRALKLKPAESIKK
jgi:ABC-type lipoprotein release transport system permease subunit